MFDQDKFKALVLYAIWRTGDVRSFGVTKLNKVLWFADARAFEALGKSITGESYVRRKFGPVPSHIKETLDALVADGLIECSSEPVAGYEAQHYTAFAPPDTSTFDLEELSLIDWWIHHVAHDHTAASISEQSHDYGWRLAKEGEELPYKAFLAKRIRAPKEGEELDWARAAAERVKAHGGSTSGSR